MYSQPLPLLWLYCGLLLSDKLKAKIKHLTRNSLMNSIWCLPKKTWLFYNTSCFFNEISKRTRTQPVCLLKCYYFSRALLSILLWDLSPCSTQSSPMQAKWSVFGLQCLGCLGWNAFSFALALNCSPILRLGSIGLSDLISSIEWMLFWQVLGYWYPSIWGYQ